MENVTPSTRAHNYLRQRKNSRTHLPLSSFLNFSRGNCEAIPEEFSGQGTTPPKAGILGLAAEVNREEDPNSSVLSSHQASSEEKSPEPAADHHLLPSFSFDDENPKLEERRLENRFFDKQNMPNEHFEFSRSASVSQVGAKKVWIPGA